MLKVGIVGCGTIGTILSRAITEHPTDIELVSIFDRHIEHSKRLASALACTPAIEDVQQMAEHVDIIVECASILAVPEVARISLINGCDVMIMSVGALSNTHLKNELINLAEKNNVRIHIPSGAIIGVDGIKSAKIAGINKVTLRTKKHPESLKGARYIKEKGINLDAINKETMIFKGTVKEVTDAFPANINVATTLALASGIENFNVEIYANPELRRNVHEITIEGGFGKFEISVENVPSPTNPKTSYLAALSAITTLKQMTNPIQIGT